MQKMSDILRVFLFVALPAVGVMIVAALASSVIAIGTIATAILLSTLSAWLLVRTERKQQQELETEFRRLSQGLRNLQANSTSTDSIKSSASQASLNAGSLSPTVSLFQKLSDEVIELTNSLHQKNAQLGKSDARYQSILQAMSEGVLLIDCDGKVAFGNSSAGKLLDRDWKAIEGRNLWEVVRNADLQSTIEIAFESEGIVRNEFEHPRTKSIIGISAVPIEVNDGQGLLIVLHDVTELRRLEKMRREFVSNVSHELKTPLTAIQAYADTLIEGGLEDVENSRMFVDRILEQAGRLQTLIHDMLRLARIESQADAFQLQTISLSEVLESCVDARQAVARSRNVSLTYDPPADEIPVVADREGLRTVFDNLINNALNYTADQGTVTVRGFCHDGRAIVEVEDNGIGIPQEHQSRIFERFYRVDKARSRGMGGTGLGLAIVKHCMGVFGGEIEVESETGRGTLIRVMLPVSEQSSQLIETVN
ncbi:ATP-binding protein [Thalassoglobus sp. JC818]|uniref:sensor histidine kinase n=1 Tax=Thalassoglobus sp. JC818 TaxID=3232136 RepID=UPI0034582179